jgi:DNA-binding response OmpR family regulator
MQPSPTVLIADDDADIRALWSRYLQKHDLRVLEAADGLEALSCLQKEAVDLCLVDWMMPRMDGLALLEAIRARQPMMPVLLVTALDDLPRRTQASEAAFDDYIVKPFDPAVLVDRIRFLLAWSLPPVAWDSPVHLGPWDWDIRRQRWVDRRHPDQSVEFSLQDVRLLGALVRRSPDAVSKQILMPLMGVHHEASWEQSLESLAAKLPGVLRVDGQKQQVAFVDPRAMVEERA